MKRFQFVWWGWTSVFVGPSFGFKEFDEEETDLALIYKWTLFIGPLEIRRWWKEMQR